VGSSVPDSMDLYLSAGNSTSQTFVTGSGLATTVTNPSGGPTLSVLGLGGGSFSFNYSYQVRAQAPAGTADGDYKGSFTVSGSSISTDNKTVPVTAHVTSQPIVTASAINPFRITQGAAKQTQYIAFGNTGLGTLNVSSITGSPSWLTASVQNNLATLIADPAGMTPGTYQATISFASNARNSPTAVPVELDVLTPGPAWTYYQRVVDNVLFTSTTLAPGEWTALFGEQLTTGSAVIGSAPPFGTSMGGATVYVNNQPAPIYYVSAGQIDFLIPYATAYGPGVVRVDQGGKTGNSVSVNIAPTAPLLLRLGIGDYANAVINDPAVPFPIPTTPGLPSRPAVAGTDVILFFGFGLGQTSPPAVDGQGASATQVNPLPTVVFGESLLPGSGVTTVPAYAGLAPTFVGLYQINVTVPANSPKGSTIPVYLNQNGVVSNRVNIAVQ
jgi:uncharacterized protein (TIGR03437 family)